MQNWVATANANFFRDNPENHTLSVMGVEIKPTEAEHVVLLKVNVDAEAIDKATQAAFEAFEFASGASRLILNTPIDFDRASISLQTAKPDSNGSFTSTILIGASLTIAQRDIELSDSATATAASGKYDSLAESKKEVRFALRWLDRALRERDPYDRFASAWIALETATYGKGPKLDNAVAALKPVYPSRTPDAILAILKPIYDTRNNIFHQASLDETDIHAKVLKTIDILFDILNYSLGISTTPRAEQNGYF